MVRTRSTTLTTDEMRLGYISGCERHLENIFRDDRPDAHGADSSMGWQYHIQGALGEIVIAKFFNIYIPPKGIFRGGDVGNMQVRCTANNGHKTGVWIWENEKDREKKHETVFWLVTGGGPRFVIHGWAYGAEIMRDHLLGDHFGKGRPSYLLPKNELHATDDFDRSLLAK